MLLCAVVAIDRFARYVERDRWMDLALSAFFMSLACLVKLPAVHLGAPLLYLAWRKEGFAFLRRPWFYAYGFAVLVPVAAWYWHAAALGAESGLTFGIWLPGEDKWANWGLVAGLEYWKRVLLYYLAKLHLTFAGAALFLIGVMLPRQGDRERLFDAWLLGSLVYLVVVGRGNSARTARPSGAGSRGCAGRPRRPRLGVTGRRPSRSCGEPASHRNRGSGATAQGRVG